MRPFRFQLWLTAALAAVLPSAASASLDSWSQGWPEAPQVQQQSEAVEPGETSSEEADEASEWGSRGLKTASGNFFEEPPDCTGKSWPQTQQPRRENGDCGYDTASDVRNGPNVYTYVTQNPWTMFDPLGLFVDEWKGSLQFSFGFGSKGRPTFSVGASVSTRTELGESAEWRNDINVRFYGGSQGTTNDKFSTSFDLTAGSFVTGMSGQGDALPNRTLNRHTESNFENTSELSATLGGMMNYNAATDDVTSHHLLGFRAGDVSFNYQNDRGGMPGLPFIDGGTDQAWTASGMLDVSLGESTSLTATYEQFTGIALSPSQGGRTQPGVPHLQNGDYNLNRGEHTIGIRSGNTSITAGYSGSHLEQDLVHKYWVPQPYFQVTDERFFTEADQTVED